MFMYVSNRQYLFINILRITALVIQNSVTMNTLLGYQSRVSTIRRQVRGAMEIAVFIQNIQVHFLTICQKRQYVLTMVENGQLYWSLHFNCCRKREQKLLYTSSPIRPTTTMLSVPMSRRDPWMMSVTLTATEWAFKRGLVKRIEPWKRCLHGPM